MVIVDTSWKRLQKLLAKKLTPEEVSDILADLGMELAQQEGDEIKIEITAERVDLITPEGLAHAINMYSNSQPHPLPTIQKSDYHHIIDPSIKTIRPFTRSFVVKNLTLSEEDIKSLMRVQEKIHDTFGRKRKKVAIGVYDLQKIHFPITYCAKKPEEIQFIPLDFSEKRNAREIIEEHPKGKEYASLLQGFDLFPIHVDAQGQILSLPPIINSHNLGKITPNTKDLFVECTGSNEEALDNIMNILATMFSDWHGQIYSVTIVDGKKTTICPSLHEKKHDLHTSVVNKLIGLNLSTAQVVQLLPKMGYKVLTVTGDTISLSIPAVRTDIWHEVDIADDIARAYGYNNIKPTLPNIATIGAMLPLNRFVEDLAQFLVGLGFNEINTFALTNHEDQYTKMHLATQPHIALGKNTQDRNLSMVRSWLLPEALKALVANRNKEFPQYLFENGIIVQPDEKADTKARNIHKLVCVMCEENADYTKIKQILQAIMTFIGKNDQVKETIHPSFINGRVGTIHLAGKTIGIIGEIHPLVLTNWDIKMPVVALEIEIEGLINTGK